MEPAVVPPLEETVLVAVPDTADVIDPVTADRSWDRLHVLLAVAKAGDAVRDATRAIHDVHRNAAELGIDDDLAPLLHGLRVSSGQLDALRLRCRQPAGSRTPLRGARPG